MIAALLGLDAIIVEAGALLLLLVTRSHAQPTATAAVAALPVIPADADDDTVIITPTRIIPPGSVMRSRGDREVAKYAQMAWDRVRSDAANWPYLMPAWQDSGWHRLLPEVTT